MFKYLYIALMLGITFTTKAQECDLSKSQVRKVYDAVWLQIEKRIVVNNDTVLGIDYLIDLLTYDQLKQACIDASYEIHKEGKEYHHKQFKAKYGFINEKYFNDNAVIICILVRLRKIVDKV